jgi:glutamine amidotransferase
MCRLYALRATGPTRVACDLLQAPNALVRQSHCDARGECHADGWGLVHYADRWPQRVRGALPAFDDPAFPDTAEELRAETVLAHVRFASVGDRSLVNTHPFVLGRWVFAHNGTVAALDHLHARLTSESRPELLALRMGSTDSEAAFVWLLSRLAAAGIDTSAPHSVETPLLRDAFAAAAAELWSRCEALEPGEAKLNFVLTDGRSLVATRINHSLHVSQADLTAVCPWCGEPHAEASSGVAYRAARLASEPLSDAGWAEVPNGSVVAIDAKAAVDVQPLPA